MSEPHDLSNQREGVASYPPVAFAIFIPVFFPDYPVETGPGSRSIEFAGAFENRPRKPQAICRRRGTVVGRWLSVVRRGIWESQVRFPGCHTRSLVPES